MCRQFPRTSKPCRSPREGQRSPAEVSVRPACGLQYPYTQGTSARSVRCRRTQGCNEPETSSTRDRTVKLAGRPFPVIRIKGLTKFKSPSPLFETKTEVIEHDAVGVKAFTIRPVHRNKLRRQVQNLPELHFLLPDLFLGCLTLSDVHHRANKFDDS